MEPETVHVRFVSEYDVLKTSIVLFNESPVNCMLSLFLYLGSDILSFALFIRRLFVYRLQLGKSLIFVQYSG